MNKLAAVARAEIPADVVIKNANIANVITRTLEHGDIAISGEYIAGIGDYSGRVEIDAGGRIIIPALIDGHIHIEDTFLTPSAFSQFAALHGTGTVFADPHEIVNAMGMSGMKFMYDDSRYADIDIFFGAPSCVPASQFEASFEEVDARLVHEMFARGWANHLGEMMNYPAIIAGDTDAWGRIAASGSAIITGHAPLVRGRELNAYISAGISSDHECESLDEAREKLSRGMYIMMREGSSFHNLKSLLELVRQNELYAARCMAVSDDITYTTLTEGGHMEPKMHIMLEAGIDPFTALRMITLTPADYFRLNDRGLIAPGRLADFVMLEGTLEEFRPAETWKSGRLIMRQGDVFTHDTHGIPAPMRTPRIKNIPDNIRVTGQGRINVIGLTPNSIITRRLILEPKTEGGYIVPDRARDMAKMIVLERHHDTGQYAVGFIQGLGITDGAIASSVNHDAHNFIAAGMDDVSILTALNELADMGGGQVMTRGHEVTHRQRLEIGGLMTNGEIRPVPEVFMRLSKKQDPNRIC